MNTETLAKQQIKLVQYATADDGTILGWIIKAPDPAKFPKPWFAVLLVHGGGFIEGTPSAPIRVCAPDLTAKGYICFSPNYRLAPPGGIAGQTSEGRYPDQTNDIQRALEAARTYDGVKGNPQFVGGSAGAYQALWFAAHGRACGVGLSPIYDLADPQTPEGPFKKKCDNYAPGTQTEASPSYYMDEESKPFMPVSYQVDNIPPNQHKALVTRLNDLGLRNDAMLLPGVGHSFDAWPDTKDEVIAFLDAHKNL